MIEILKLLEELDLGAFKEYEKDDAAVNIAVIDARAKIISDIATFVDGMQTKLNTLKKMRASLIKVQDSQVTKLDSMINKWRIVCRTSARSENNVTSAAALNVGQIPMIKQVKPIAPAQEAVHVSKSLTIKARVVKSINDITMSGEVYYIPTIDQFAIKIASHVYHGNIGTIYTNESQIAPVKIRTCTYGAQCKKWPKCDYYHDPLTSDIVEKEHRNYINMNWIYTKNANSNSRHFGSRDNLEADIITVSREESERLNDQVMHEILCSILLNSKFA